jgi:3-hydroxyisobutyrate dehydrogenase-like beta-hydroxyacid dehydrogenase
MADTHPICHSEDTIERAKKANVELLPSDVDLVTQCAAILSVVPPRDAVATAQRVVDGMGTDRTEPLFLFDLNAVSPGTCRQIEALVERSGVQVRLVDGCLLGGPPKQVPESSTTFASGTGEDKSTQQQPTPSSIGQIWAEPAPSLGWTLPGIPISGPHSTDLDSASSPGLVRTLYTSLGMYSLGPSIGSASGLKMCFGSLAKGLAAIAFQSFTTAHSLGLLPHLRRELAARLPSHLALAERTVVGVPPKAYRWVREMEEIDDTFRLDGGFSFAASGGGGMFAGAADLFRAVAEDTVLGEERIGRRKRGTTVEDVAQAMVEGLAKKKKKTE